MALSSLGSQKCQLFSVQVKFKTPDRLDRELRTIELQSLLLFYSRRATRYKYLNEETAKECEEFILSLQNGDYTIRFKKMGFIYEFQSDSYQRKDVLNDTIFYILGKPMIGMIIEDVDCLRTVDVSRIAADEEMKTDFETSDRILREDSFRLNNEVEDKKDSPLADTTGDEIPSTKDGLTSDSTPEISFESNVESESSADTTWVTTSQQPDPITPKVEPVSPPAHKHQTVPSAPTISSTPAPKENEVVFDPNYQQLSYDILIGKTSGSEQYGILGESIEHEWTSKDCYRSKRD